MGERIVQWLKEHVRWPFGSEPVQPIAKPEAPAVARFVFPAQMTDRSVRCPDANRPMVRGGGAANLMCVHVRN